MLAYIKGILEAKYNDYVVIDVGGLGYKIFMSTTAIDKLEEIGKEVKVHTYFRIREDDISIFGFNSKDELRMFELLLSVSGIGAKTSLNMLATVNPSQFALAVISGDVTKLTQIPGIGKKSAERIILELKDKMKTEQKNVKVDNSKNSELKEVIIQDDRIGEAMSALLVLGYNRKEVDKVFEKIDKTNLSVEEIIKKGLKLLSM